MNLSAVSTELHRALAWAGPWIAQYGLIALAVGLFIENLSLIGFWFPGVWFAPAAGYLVADGRMGVVQAFLALLLGTVCGDSLSYFLGELGFDGFLQRRPRVHQRIARLFASKTHWLILAFHFAAILRPFVPVFAGSVRYPFGRWVMLSTAGAAVWLATLMTVGGLLHRALDPTGGVVWFGLNFLGAAVTILAAVLIVRRLD